MFHFFHRLCQLFCRPIQFPLLPLITHSLSPNLPPLSRSNTTPLLPNQPLHFSSYHNGLRPRYVVTMPVRRHRSSSTWRPNFGPPLSLRARPRLALSRSSLWVGCATASVWQRRWQCAELRQWESEQWLAWRTINFTMHEANMSAQVTLRRGPTSSRPAALSATR